MITSFDYSIQKQYKILMKYAEEYRPELFLKMITDDLFEFHHILWDMPFYKRIYQYNNKSFINSVSTYIQPIDGIMYGAEIMKFNIYHYRKNRIYGSFSIEKETINYNEKPELFESYVKYMMKNNPIKSDELPKGLIINLV